MKIIRIQDYEKKSRQPDAGGPRDIIDCDVIFIDTQPKRVDGRGKRRPLSRPDVKLHLR
jgi:hypothetical protein